MKNSIAHRVGCIAGCTMAIALAPFASAQVSTNDFNDLKNSVDQLNGKVQKLEQTHEQDEKTREQNETKIRELQEQLGQTQIAVTNATEKAEAAAQVQPVHPVPPGPAATHNFTMVGDAEVQFGQVIGSHSAFALADFAPIFLFRGGNDVLFEAGFDVALQNNAPASPGATTTVDLSFAQLDYLVNDYATFVGGYMLLPLGTYTERSAGWLNKIPDDPLPISVLPSNGAGIQLRGAVPVGASSQMITYSLYGVNGPSSVDGTGNADQLDLGGNVGINSDGSFGNLHSSPAGGGRIGWFYPWKAHYDLELGISGQTGPWDNANNLMWSAAVVDAALHVSPYFELKGEYINTWQQTANAGTIQPKGWWIQAAYKLSSFDLDFPGVNNLELVGRYDTVRNGLTSWTDRWTVGYVYYFSSTLLFEGDYEFLSSNDPTQAHNDYVFQLSYGF
jgi:hypothetical protein